MKGEGPWHVVVRLNLSRLFISSNGPGRNLENTTEVGTRTSCGQEIVIRGDSSFERNSGVN